MQSIKAFAIFAMIGTLVAGSALAGGSTVATGPTIPPQGVTETSVPGSSTAARMSEAYGVEEDETSEDDFGGCPSTLFCSPSGPGG